MAQVFISIQKKIKEKPKQNLFSYKIAKLTIDMLWSHSHVQDGRQNILNTSFGRSLVKQLQRGNVCL